MKNLKVILFVIGIWAVSLVAEEPRNFSVTVIQGSLQKVFQKIADQAGYELVMTNSVDRTVSYDFDSKPLKHILEVLSRDNNLEYKVVEKRLYVFGKEGRRVGPGSTRIPIHYSDADNVAKAMPKFLNEKESISVDKDFNALVFYGSERTLRKVQDFVKAFDKAPPQVFIEAQIVETSKSYSQDLGFKYGDLTGSAALNTDFKWGGSVTPSTTSSPHFTLNYYIGTFGGNQLEASLLAAESRGDAKIISRPKVITLNNQTANIQSGVTYNVKTLSSTTVADDSGDLETVSGGLEEISAGLDLKVKPTVVDGGKVKLIVNVENSEPDDSLAVDGIPGIVDNSANTSIIINDGETVSLVGLVKSDFSHTETGVPWLRRIPILGVLFGGYSKSDSKKELVIFITPRVIQPKDMKNVDMLKQRELPESVSGL